MSNVKLVSTPILNYYDSKLKKFLSSTYALKSDVSDGGGILYAECSTAYNINNKVVACGGFALQKGACIAIMFTDTSTTAPTTGNITLNINNTGAKTIVPKGNNTVITQGWAWAFRANQTQVFMYNGTNFIWLNQDNNTIYTPMALGFGYGTCTTAEATTAKVATLASYVLIKGGMVSVKFTNAVPASATLNINGKGAKYIYYHGAKILAGIINANDIATFVYDGTEYQLIAIDNEARIKANTSNIAKNAAAIQKINDASSGILATAKSYTDSALPSASVSYATSAGNADTLAGKGIANLVLNESINDAINSQISIPANVNVAEWLRQNAKRGMNYVVNETIPGLTGLPGDYPYWSWYTCDGCNIFAKTMDNRFFYLWELNSTGYQWRQIQFTDNIDFQIHNGELDANKLKEINPGIFGYKCTHWINHPSENFDSQGTIIDILFESSGPNRWRTQYFISPHSSSVWKRCFSTTNMTEWERITHHFWSGTTTAKSNTLNFKPSMVMVFNGDFVSTTNASNGFITITNTGFDFASAPDKAYGVYAFA